MISSWWAAVDLIFAWLEAIICMKTDLIKPILCYSDIRCSWWLGSWWTCIVYSDLCVYVFGFHSSSRLWSTLIAVSGFTILPQDLDVVVITICPGRYLYHKQEGFAFVKWRITVVGDYTITTWCQLGYSGISRKFCGRMTYYCRRGLYLLTTQWWHTGFHATLLHTWVTGRGHRVCGISSLRITIWAV